MSDETVEAVETLDTIDDFQALLAMGPMAAVANPYPLYKKLRDESPVLHVEDAMADPNLKGSVVLTRYDDVKLAMRGIEQEVTTG